MVNIRKGRDAIKGDMDSLEKWIDKNLMNLNNTKFKLLILSWNNARYEHKTGKSH